MLQNFRLAKPNDLRTYAGVFSGQTAELLERCGQIDQLYEKYDRDHQQALCFLEGGACFFIQRLQTIYGLELVAHTAFVNQVSIAAEIVMNALKKAADESIM